MDFLLRPWEESDAESLAKYANDPRVPFNLTDAFPNPYSISDAYAFIKRCREKDPEEFHRAIVIDGEAAGCVSIIPQKDIYRKNAEIGYWLAVPFWGHGIMTRAAGQICREAFARYDLARIYARVNTRNPASRRVLEKNNFVLECVMRNSVYKYGKLLDSWLLALLRDECINKEENRDILETVSIMNHPRTAEEILDAMKEDWKTGEIYQPEEKW